MTEAGAPVVQPLTGFKDRIQRAMECICRVDIGGNPAGTGFLVGPATVLTNFHVVEPALRQGALLGVSCFFDFVALPGGGMHTGARIAVGQLLASSPYGRSEDQGALAEAPPEPPELDFALLRLDAEQGRTPAPASARARGWLPLSAAPPRVARDGALYIVQHPAGGPAVVASNMQGIRRFAPGRLDRLVYQVQTSAGSSGSPCFNDNWELVALHNYGDPAWGNANLAFRRGVPINLIQAEIVRQNLEGAIPTAVDVADVDSVAAVLRSLAAAVAGDDRLRDRVGDSRGVLAEIATRLDYLVAYKALHDFLHEVQKTRIPSLRIALMLADDDETLHGIADNLVIEVGQCRAEAAHTRPEGSESRRRQIEWIDEVEAGARRLRDEVLTPEGKRDQIEQIRRTARKRLARLNNALVGEACDIDLRKLGVVLRDGGAVARSDAAPESLERLSLELDRLVGDHQLWQDLENDLQGLEDRVRDGRSVIDREGFQSLWREVWPQIQGACERDLAAAWAIGLAALGAGVETRIAEPGWERVGRAFGDFRRAAMDRFFRIDKALLAHCQEIGRLGEPIESLLRLVP